MFGAESQANGRASPRPEQSFEKDFAEDSQDGGESERLPSFQTHGLFVNRNIQIAPHFKEYAVEKRKILMHAQLRQRWNALKNKEEIEMNHRKNKEFSLIRWQVYRAMEEKRLLLEKQLKRQRIATTLWVASRLVAKIARKAHQNIGDLTAWK